MYDPTEGKILLNGIDIKEINYDDYLSLFSVVFQDFRLFSFSLGQNIAAASNYIPEHAENCLYKSGFGDRYKTMPKGLDTCLYRDFEDDGIEISGGEAQKIAIARALYKDAPYIILDELLPWIQLLKRRYTQDSMIWWKEKLLYTSAIECHPAVFVTGLQYLITGKLYRKDRIRSFLLTNRESIMSCGMHRPNIIPD